MPTDSEHYTSSGHYIVKYSDAIAGHEMVILVSGGRSGVLNEPSLLSALARPYCGYFDTLEEKAAVLMEAIIQNHGFVDGNKRTAAFLLFYFITMSKCWISPIPESENIDLELENLAVELASGQANSETVVQWLRPRLKPI
ncbi:MAG: type II toxin-antitoxin system death-on-curing family toxin [Rhodobacteraceae bacterium]|nr:type II toxin-antitoxin system death-on-curing family toxin [Paracoccaceae bacterium]